MKRQLGFFLTILLFISINSADANRNAQRLLAQSFVDQKIINWISSNISKETSLPLSFHIKPEDRTDIFSSMGQADNVSDIIERMIVDEGLVIYDGAVGQIVLSIFGGQNEMKLAQKPIDVYWRGETGELSSIRAGYPINNFVYDPEHPELVSSKLSDEGKRGFIYRIINANGLYNSQDPLDGKKRFEGFPNWPTVHWEDWKPVAGENAWVSIAALHLYHKKYFQEATSEYIHETDSTDLRLAKELARVALIMQADVGGVRMAPIGTFREVLETDTNPVPQGHWWYNQISSENNISWYAAFRMLYELTDDERYYQAMLDIEKFFRSIFDQDEYYFYQGMHCKQDGQWYKNDDHFALDVQTWGIGAFGAHKIDQWFGKGAAYRIYKTAMEKSGTYTKDGQLAGVGYVVEHDRLSVEWTAGAIMAAMEIARYYGSSNPKWAKHAYVDAQTMRKGVEKLKMNLSEDRKAYSYSSKRGWIPFGWYSHDPRIMSLASTGWIVFVDAGFNPFLLENKQLDFHPQKRMVKKQRVLWADQFNQIFR